MSAWEVTATDYDASRTEWFRETVEASDKAAAYAAAEKIANDRDQGSRFRGSDFLWRVTARELPTGERTITYPANHPDLTAGYDCQHESTQRRTALV